MSFQGQNKFQKRLVVLLERFYLRFMQHSLFSLLKYGRRSPDMDHAFLNVAQNSLGYLLQRVRQSATRDLGQVLEGLYATNIRVAQESAGHILESIRQLPTVQAKQLIRSLYATNIDLVDATVQLYGELNGMAIDPEVDGERLSGISLRLAGLMDQVIAREVGRQILSDQLPPEERFLIPRLREREKPVLNTWSCQNDLMDWDIGADELVLDVGSGGWPFGKATHLADMFVGETTHRFERLRRDGRPFFVVDVSRMPFADKTWDFVFCSHVLEHLDRPGDAIRELSRISRRGYIEVPTRLSDVMLNFTRLKNHHRWHGLVLGDMLVLIEWKEEERRDLGSNYFFECLQSQYHNEFQDLFERNWDLFYSQFKWEDSIKFLIISNDGTIIDRSNDG